MTHAAQTAVPDRTSRWLPWAGGVLGLVALAWAMRGFDFNRFAGILSNADLRLLALVPLSILAEQLVRAWSGASCCTPCAQSA